MKNPIYFSILVLLISSQLFSQYEIGHTTITFEDTARGNRQIETELYYPANTAGDNVAIAAGSFPYIIFGHGFVMSWDTYGNFVDTLIPKGYIIAFPSTEGSMSPSHEEFGLDLRFLVNEVYGLNSDNLSLFYGAINTECAIMGHSMGGGSAFLAAQNNTDITTLITFAAANTTPSSITAAQDVTIPVLVFSGEEDGVAPPADHQVPMYDSLASNCKTFISIIGGGHCNFANYNVNCSFGELTTGGSGSITREELHATLFSFLKPWLEYYLQNINIWDDFTDSLVQSNKITYDLSCTQTGLTEFSNNEKNLIYPNPANNNFQLNLNNNEQYTLIIFNIDGQNLYSKEIYSNQKIDISHLKNGIYIVKIFNDNEEYYSKKLTILH